MLYKYPEKLTELLTDQESEGNEIFTTQTQDETLWIIPQKNLDNWIVVLSWAEGMGNHFECINICGKAFNRLKKVMDEECKS